MDNYADEFAKHMAGTQPMPEDVWDNLLEVVDMMNGGIPNGDVHVIVAKSDCGRSLIGKCRTCFHMSEYNSDVHECTVGYEVIELEDFGLHPDTHGCEQWESVDDED